VLFNAGITPSEQIPLPAPTSRTILPAAFRLRRAFTAAANPRIRLQPRAYRCVWG